MNEIEFGKKYLASYYNYESEAVYLGKKLNKKLCHEKIIVKLISISRSELDVRIL